MVLTAVIIALEIANAYLIVNRTEIHIRLHLLSRNATAKHILAGVVEAMLDENAGHIFDLGRRTS
jgi:hypothetical protein